MALTVERHEFNRAAQRWFQSVDSRDAIVCRLAQLGLLRHLGNPTLMGEDVLSPLGAWRACRNALKDDRFLFQLDEPEGLDGCLQRIAASETKGYKWWSDAYLAAFAMASGIPIVTFDKGFPRFSGLRFELLGK